jgi:NAD(P)-dependent dehydrogenase (short-subunit alcohol dehydrogenase family)
LYCEATNASTNSRKHSDVMKTVLITGGNRGLGKALVDTFSEAGWKVLATARRAESIDRGDDSRSENIQAYSLDLSKHDDIAELVRAVSSSHHDTKIDCIIHNAGFNPKDNKSPAGYFESTFSVKDFDAANVAESMMINALHPMELTGRLLPLLAPDGVVLAITSWLGSIGAKTVPGHYGYSGSKALMNLCMKGLALEFDRDATAAAAASGSPPGGVQRRRAAVALNPGWMKTDMGGGDRADISPEEVAARILRMIDDGFLRSCSGKFINTDRTEHEW